VSYHLLVRRLAWCFLLLILAANERAFAQAPVSYVISIPEPQHHWMQVEAVFPDLPRTPAQLIISRSSPGRYAVHEFVKNVYDVQIDDGNGGQLAVQRPSANQWDVANHSGNVRVRYRVFGDAIDGTYLGIDMSHAHINIPPVLMWARGLEGRPARITFQPPAGTSWKVATQLHASDDPQTFTAPNLSYLVDSPVELSSFATRTFTLDQSFRIALHHDGNDRDADRFAEDVQRIVREERAVFGELPAYENGYTFIVDMLPYVAYDGMEHRNSTIITFPGALRVPDQRVGALSTVAHEFFHSWNVERIRPKSLEPFNLEDTNTTGELWFAEGFTNYYEALIMARTGFGGAADFASNIGGIIDTVVNSPARKHRSAEDMSRMATVVDGAASRDRNNWDNTYISYYTWGAAIAVGLDLSLRERSQNGVTLDDFMRAMWRRHGQPAAAAEGTVAHPYTAQDLKDRLSEVAGDPDFAARFFERFVQGREVVDYQRLLARAGFVLRKRSEGRAWIGPLALRAARGTAVVVEPTLEDTPVYDAGLDRDDEILSVDGENPVSAERIEEILRRHKPGDTLRVVVRRRGVSEPIAIDVEEDPSLELIAADTASLTAEQRRFRDAWLAAKASP
jgi:predicted metalloprotease with PDZ domain